MQLMPFDFEKHAVFIRESSYEISITSVLFCLTSYVQRAYFVRSTCLLRTFNVFTSYEVRQTHQVFWENTSDFLAIFKASKQILLGVKTNFQGIGTNHQCLKNNFQGLKDIGEWLQKKRQCFSFEAQKKGSFHSPFAL